MPSRTCLFKRVDSRALPHPYFPDEGRLKALLPVLNKQCDVLFEATNSLLRVMHVDLPHH